MVTRAAVGTGNGNGGGNGTAPRREWLTIHEASDLIGVSPATLRRWSDAGEIKAFTTPGGHRRFARAAVLGLIPRDRRTTGHERLGDIADRIARAYRRSPEGAGAAIPWLRALDDAQRAAFRELGGAMAAAILELLDDASEAAGPEALARAESNAAAFGALAAALGATVGETVDAFLSLRKPFLRELAGAACRRGYDGRATADLLDTATEAIDRLLCALVRGHQAGVQGVGAPATTTGAAVTATPLAAVAAI